jgi:hypothetical protein
LATPFKIFLSKVPNKNKNLEAGLNKDSNLLVTSLYEAPEGDTGHHRDGKQ